MSIKMEIDKQLLRMFENFPHTNMTDGMSASFQKACEGKPLHAIVGTVDKFVFGRCDRSNKTFLPTVAEFSEHLDREQQDSQIAGREGGVKLPDKEIGISRLETIFEVNERREKFYSSLKPFKENVTQQEFAEGCKRKAWPEGSTWLWQTQSVYAGEEADKVRRSGGILRRRYVLTNNTHVAPEFGTKGEAVL